MSEHTPGPWQDIGNCRIHGTPAYPENMQHTEGSDWEGVPSNSLNEVCVAFPASVYGYSKGGKERPVRRDVEERWWARNKANIALICAAPDLLEACEAAIAAFDGSNIRIAQEHVVALALLRSAISKASTETTK